MPAPSPERLLLALGPPRQRHSSRLPAFDRAVRRPPAHYRRGASRRGLKADHAPAEPAARPLALPAGRRPCLRSPPRSECPPGHPESRLLGVEGGRGREPSRLCARLCEGIRARNSGSCLPAPPRTGYRLGEGSESRPASPSPARSWLGAVIWDTRGGAEDASRLHACLPCCGCGCAWGGEVSGCRVGNCGRMKWKECLVDSRREAVRVAVACCACWEVSAGRCVLRGGATAQQQIQRWRSRDLKRDIGD